MESFKDKCKSLFRSRCCFACCVKPPALDEANEPSKGLRNKNRKVKNFGKSENFWSSSAVEMDKSAVQSQPSTSQSLEPHTNTSSKSSSNEFVNNGLLLWNQTRQQWIGNKQSKNQKQVQDPTINWNATYESLLGTSKPFPSAIPLVEMVDFLVNIWEQEGLYE